VSRSPVQRATEPETWPGARAKLALQPILVLLLSCVVLLSAGHAQPWPDQEDIWREFVDWLTSAPRFSLRIEHDWYDHLASLGFSSREVARRVDIVRQRLQRTPEAMRLWYNILYTRYLLQLPEEDSDDFLARALEGVQPGRALVINLGQGLAALALARAGWQVQGFDLSDVAVAQAAAASRRLGVPLQVSRASFAQYDQGENRWDLIVMLYAYVPIRTVASGQRLVRALRPQGRLVFENYEPHWQDRSADLAGTLREEDLLRVFAGLEVVMLEKKSFQEPLHAGTAIIRFVGRKP